MNDYILQSDTDSLYVDACDILKHRFSDIDLNDDERVVGLIKPIMSEFQDEMNEWYIQFSRERFNSKNNRLRIKSETIAKKIYISVKKQYAQYIFDKEGVRMEGEDRFDFKGLDFMKSSFPPLFRIFTQGLIKDILFDAPKSKIDGLILEFRDNFKNLPLMEVGKPTGVNKDLRNYIRRKPSPSQIFSQIMPKTGPHIKSAIFYNDLLRFKQLDKSHSVLQIGDKIKWMYLKDNPYKIKTLAYAAESPQEILDFVEKYMDRQEMFNSLLVKKLEKIYDNLSWGEINFNSNTKKFFRYNSN